MSLEASGLRDQLTKSRVPLGFGCGELRIGRGRRASIRLLREALDQGVVYFDTARLYGHGEAEAILAEAIGPRRDQIVIASKAGILPNPPSLAKRVVDRSANALRRLPALRPLVPSPIPARPRFGMFDIKSLRASVETSLRELNTDYLDVLLLHECARADVANLEIHAFADDLRRQGKIRAFGIAPTPEHALAIQTAGVRFGDIVQFASNPYEDNMARLQLAEGQLAILHSCLGKALRETLHRLRGDAVTASRWRERLGVDPTSGDVMAQLFLAYAHWRNPQGLILFSTNSAAHLKDNLSAAGQVIRQAPQLAQLPELVTEIMASPPHASTP